MARFEERGFQGVFTRPRMREGGSPRAQMAEADGNRTRRGRVATPPTGFEVRGQHQHDNRFRPQSTARDLEFQRRSGSSQDRDHTPFGSGMRDDGLKAVSFRRGRGTVGVGAG
jgi:hypothetical protein